MLNIDPIDQERFFAKTKRETKVRPGMETPCLEWTARKNNCGYGSFRRSNTMALAHRVAWELANGCIPDGICVCHVCDNPSCVLVEHLFLGTNAQNIADRDSKGRQASGDRSGARTKPERMFRVWDLKNSVTHPETLARGERHGRAKLTEDDVRSIFYLRSQGWLQQRLATRFGVSRTVVGHILHKKLWAHVQCQS